MVQRLVAEPSEMLGGMVNLPRGAPNHAPPSRNPKSRAAVGGERGRSRRWPWGGRLDRRHLHHRLHRLIDEVADGGGGYLLEARRCQPAVQRRQPLGLPNVIEPVDHVGVWWLWCRSFKGYRPCIE